MKLQDLYENKNSALFTALTKELTKAGEELEASIGKQSSHNIGGNFSAVVSGNVGIRTNYIDYGSYNSATRWDQMLEIGNNIKGKDALDEARRIYKDLLKIATDQGATVKEIEKNRFATIVDEAGNKLDVCSEYARSFCWVGIKKI